ncbi:hypothetical protein ELD80_32905, partial [Klebsiella pneumoniae]|nr:hypothetical protein [Klebsiella pneumoniae]
SLLACVLLFIPRLEIQMAEGFIEGCLAILNVSLDMD